MVARLRELALPVLAIPDESPSCPVPSSLDRALPGHGDLERAARRRRIRGRGGRGGVEQDEARGVKVALAREQRVDRLDLAGPVSQRRNGGKSATRPAPEKERVWYPARSDRAD